MAQVRISEATLRKVRDYVVEEPSYTNAYAAWELGISRESVACATTILESKGIVVMFEKAAGPHGATYRYAPIEEPTPKKRRTTARGGVGSENGALPVATTGRRKGRAGSPMQDAKRQANGHQLRRTKRGS
jgi:hypothetical protein